MITSGEALCLGPSGRAAFHGSIELSSFGTFFGFNSPVWPFDRILVTTGDSPFDCGVLVGTIIDATIPGVGDAMLHLQLEIPEVAPAPDNETARGLVRRRKLADKNPILHAPNVGIGVPSIQGLTVEYGFEAGIFVGRYLRNDRFLRWPTLGSVQRRG